MFSFSRRIQFSIFLHRAGRARVCARRPRAVGGHGPGAPTGWRSCPHPDLSHHQPDPFHVPRTTSQGFPYFDSFRHSKERSRIPVYFSKKG